MAAQTLAKIRKKFVDGVTKEVISQLLDDMLEDHILNDGEKESILEENFSRRDKARNLIDTVKRKGDKASKKLVACICCRDPTLSSELGLSCDEAAPSEPPNQEWSLTLKPTTDAFWMEKQKDKNNIYPVTRNSIRNRVALLITNIKFTNENLNRKGAEKDEENMEKLLSDLGYKVVKHTNLTAKEIDEALIQFSKHPNLKETDSVLVVIMSHGKLDKVLGANWKKTISADEEPDEFPINNIYKHLGPQPCGDLVDKPKIIIIQACRGEGEGAVLVCDGVNQAVDCDDVPHQRPAAEENMEDDATRCVHREKDFISLLSSTPDTVSYRQRDRGSILIQYVVDVFNTYACTEDIEKLFTKVMRRFEDFNPGIKRQMATKDRCTFTKAFYFFPGQYKELARVRGRFVDKVSKPLLKQLLDDLLEDGLLNDGEKDSVLEDNSNKADMARALIDMVKRKGDKASRKMIDHIKDRDHSLYSELGLSGPPAAAAPKKEQGWSHTMITTTDSFLRDKQDDQNVYRVAEQAIKHRVALLITNRDFADKRLTRKGAEIDEENMLHLLSKLNYEVVKHRNLTGKQMEEAMRDFSKHPKLKETDSVFVVIMSHGKLGAVLGVNYSAEEADEFPVDKIYKCLDTANCPALRNKPKVIIIQACRGEAGGAVLVSDSAVVSDDLPPPGPAPFADADNIFDDSVKCAHKEKDFISLLSSTPDTVSYRQENLGSFLIQYIIEVFNTYAHEHDIEELFRRVMRRFEDFSAGNKRQMPTKDRCTLTKRFYLCP
ncbi:caspase-1-like [Parambassis ranga]|uniref:Caspase-1-like n=1 Tax=Parambassis ranga TaxID=210632 RepID=A0A6P7JG70_9TELE|nr:caspase-1-like [Parambassis ranga]